MGNSKRSAPRGEGGVGEVKQNVECGGDLAHHARARWPGSHDIHIHIKNPSVHQPFVFVPRLRRIQRKHTEETRNNPEVRAPYGTYQCYAMYRAWIERWTDGQTICSKNSEDPAKDVRTHSQQPPPKPLNLKSSSLHRHPHQSSLFLLFALFLYLNLPSSYTL
jgi:hypothetical protein